jgi:hypothetical protein
MQIFGSRFVFYTLIPYICKRWKKRWRREIRTWLVEPPVQMEAPSE